MSFPHSASIIRYTLIYISISASLFILSGCAPRLKETLNSQTLTAPVSPLIKIHIDEIASEIRWNHAVSIPEDQPREMRRQIARQLESALNGSGSFRGDVGYYPARYLLEVHQISTKSYWILFPCLLYGTFVGCPYQSMRAEVTLSVEYQGKIFSISDSGVAYFNYYNEFLYPLIPQLSPVADALGKIVPQLAQQMRSETPKSPPNISRVKRARPTLSLLVIHAGPPILDKKRSHRRESHNRESHNRESQRGTQRGTQL